jgi:hypothetical protein
MTHLHQTRILGKSKSAISPYKHPPENIAWRDICGEVFLYANNMDLALLE